MNRFYRLFLSEFKLLEDILMIFKALLDNLSSHFKIYFRATVDYKIFFYLFPGMLNLFQSNTVLMKIKSHFFHLCIFSTLSRLADIANDVKVSSRVDHLQRPSQSSEITFVSCLIYHSTGVESRAS